MLKLSTSENQRKRKGLFIFVGGAKPPNLFEPIIAAVKSWFALWDLTYTRGLLFSRIDAKEAIAEHHTALEKTFLAGQRLIEES